MQQCVTTCVHVCTFNVRKCVKNLTCGCQENHCRLIRLPIFLVASNAAVGGPSTASTFAESLQLTELVVPAAVCGTLGYALGTPVAFVARSEFGTYQYISLFCNTGDVLYMGSALQKR